MEFKASHRYAPLTARKARPVVNMVRGLPVNDALEALATTHRRAGFLLRWLNRRASSITAAVPVALSTAPL